MSPASILVGVTVANRDSSKLKIKGGTPLKKARGSRSTGLKYWRSNFILGYFHLILVRAISKKFIQGLSDHSDELLA